MPRRKADTVRTNVYLTEEAAQLLTKLAESERKRGQYLSDLIVKAARGAGLLPAEQPPPGSELAARLDTLEQEVAELRQERKDATINMPAL